MALRDSILEYEPKTLRQRGRIRIAGPLIMIAILSGFAAILWPAITKPNIHTSQTRCLFDMKQIGLALHMYAAEHNGRFMDQLDPKRVPDPTCPGTRQGTPVPYVYLGKGLNRSSVTSRHVLLYEPLGNHTRGKSAGINVLLGDGSVRSIPTAQAPKIIAELQSGLNPPPSLK